MVLQILMQVLRFGQSMTSDIEADESKVNNTELTLARSGALHDGSKVLQSLIVVGIDPVFRLQ